MDISSVYLWEILDISSVIGHLSFFSLRKSFQVFSNLGGHYDIHSQPSIVHSQYSGTNTHINVPLLQNEIYPPAVELPELCHTSSRNFTTHIYV